MQTELFAESDTKPEREIDIKSSLWEESVDLRPNLPLKLRQVKNYTANGLGRESYTNELYCLGKVLPIASVTEPSNAVWLLKGWMKILGPIMDKYEVAGYVQKPATIKTPDEFIRAVVTCPEFLEKYKE